MDTTTCHSHSPSSLNKTGLGEADVPLVKTGIRTKLTTVTAQWICLNRSNPSSLTKLSLSSLPRLAVIYPSHFGVHRRVGRALTFLVFCQSPSSMHQFDGAINNNNKVSLVHTPPSLSVIVEG